MPLSTVRFHALTRSCRRWIGRVATMLLCLAPLAIALSTPTPATAQNANQGIVAVVNAQPITRNELGKAALDRFGTIVLDNMVNKHLILAACEQNNCQPTREEVDAEIKRMAAKFGFSVEQYIGLLQKERDITLRQYQTEIIWPMLALRRLAQEQVEVTQEEFNMAYHARFGEAVKCRVIDVKDRAKAEKLHQQATAEPKTFAKLAKQYSEDETSASVGGLIPPIRRHTGDAKLEDAVFALKDGEVSPIMMLGDRWIILQAVRRIPATPPPPNAIDQVKEQLYDDIRDQKMRSASGKIFAELQKQAQVKIVLGNAELETQNPGVAARVGAKQITIAQLTEQCIDRNGKEVLEALITRRMVEQALKQAGKQITDADLQKEIAEVASLYGHVRQDGSADMDSWLRKVTADTAISRKVYVEDDVWPTTAMKKLVSDKITITDEDRQRGFQTHYGPRAEVLAIVLSDQRTAENVWKAARDGKTEETFGRLAERHSVEPVSASNRGKVPPIQRFGGQPAIEKEAFALKPGELSGIIATNGQYVILRLQGFTKPVVTDPAEVKDQLEEYIRVRKLKIAIGKEMDRIRKASEVDNFLAAKS
ncbi:MAG: peptidylprolyl isomerase [Planctomycetota bacterium]